MEPNALGSLTHFPKNPIMTAQPDNTPSSLSAETMAEIDAAMKEMEAHGAAEPAPVKAGAPARLRGPRVVQAGREHRNGKVVSVGPTDIFIEFGPKELGILSRTQYPEDKDLPVVGTDLEVVVDKFESGDNVFICSRPGAVSKADWEKLDAGQVVEARVTGVVNGKDNKPAGLELEVANHRAFMPASQVSFDHIADLKVFVGEKMTCAVVRVERMGKGNIVLSRRDVLKGEREENAKKLRETLQEGQTVEGTVRKIMPFGAFVDLGGLDGLVHFSEISYDRSMFGEKHIAKHIQEGQRVNVRILKIDDEKKQIALSIKQVAGDPFAQQAAEIVEGAELQGKVTKILEFGAFVELAQGIDGLVHISEIDYKRINKVEDVLKQDEVVRVKVLKVDVANRKISLSIKALKPAPEMPARAPRGDGKPGEAGKEGGAPAGGGNRGFGGGKPGGFGGGRGGFGKEKIQGRSVEEITKETPALRRQREKFKQFQFKGGLG